MTNREQKPLKCKELDRLMQRLRDEYPEPLTRRYKTLSIPFSRLGAKS
jgi:hypothetical protein